MLGIGIGRLGDSKGNHFSHDHRYPLKTGLPANRSKPTSPQTKEPSASTSRTWRHRPVSPPPEELKLPFAAYLEAVERCERGAEPAVLTREPLLRKGVSTGTVGVNRFTVDFFWGGRTC